ncbi:MAG TPA: chaperonin GroEL [Nitrospinaceae bacterium]|jgi:chaperonin GroEL|nr:chaperonin GroEL [Nitrospinaceae bacterium]
MQDENRVLIFSQEAREKLLEGVNLLADAVKTTMGPSGQNVIIESSNGPPVLTKDGVTVARSINLKDSYKNLGVQLVKEAASRTAETAGDGTTTATILSQALFQEGVKLLTSGHNAVKVREGMIAAKEKVLQNLEKMARPVNGDEDIINVGTISANGDREIGELLCQAMNAVGTDGVITVEEAKGFLTSLEVVNGLKLNRGFVSPYFVTNGDRLICELEKPVILLANQTISSINDLLPILEACHREGHPLVIVVDEIEGEVLKALVLNSLKGLLKICVIKSPEFGNARVDALSDLGIIFNTKVYSSAEDLPSNLEDLGFTKRVIISRYESIFVTQEVSKEEVQKRVDAIKTMINSPDVTTDEASALRRRLANLAGAVAVLRVGGSTETELKERKDRVEDALHATQAAVEEGILPGGGLALLRAANKIKLNKSWDTDFYAGFSMVLEAVKAPVWNICTNCGESPDLIIHKILEEKDFIGYDAREKRIGDLLQLGIIDPKKVVRCALENSISAANSLLSVGCSIVYDE